MPVCFANVEAKLSNESIRFAWNLEAGSSPYVWAQFSADHADNRRVLMIKLRDGSAEV
jgi:hypothetical protein